MRSLIVLVLFLSLIGIGYGIEDAKYVPAPDCGGETEYVSNASVFTIGEFGTGHHTAFMLAVNNTRQGMEGLQVAIGNDSIIFQSNMQPGWRTIHEEKFNKSIVLEFIIYHEFGTVATDKSFESVTGKNHGLSNVRTVITIEVSKGKAKTSYTAFDAC